MYNIYINMFKLQDDDVKMFRVSIVQQEVHINSVSTLALVCRTVQSAKCSFNTSTDFRA
jgi:hypothetical protein